MAGTLDDLAALSGVSRATVSRVINGGSVSEATRDRVMAVLERTGYRPNLAAQNAGVRAVGCGGGRDARRVPRAVPGSVLLPAAAGHERRAVRDGDRHDAVAREPFEAGDARPDPGHGTARGRDRHRVQPGGPAGRRAADVIAPHGARRSPPCRPIRELRGRRSCPGRRQRDIAPGGRGEAPDRPHHRTSRHRRGRRSHRGVSARHGPGAIPHGRTHRRRGLPQSLGGVGGTRATRPRRGCDLLRERRDGRRRP